jgi:hypothetical protein
MSGRISKEEEEKSLAEVRDGEKALAREMQDRRQVQMRAPNAA